MSPGAPVDLFVDLAECGRLHAALQTLIAELEDPADPARGDLSPAAMGNDAVAGAAERYVTAWSDGRERMRANLIGCRGLVELAIQRYQAVEAALRAASLDGVAGGP